MSVSRGTQQRLVQRYSFELPTISEMVEEISHREGKELCRDYELPTASEAVEEINHPEGKEPCRDYELPPTSEKEPCRDYELPTVSEAVEEISHPEGKEPCRDYELPTFKEVVKEMSIDGGKVRLRTPLGQPCEWRDVPWASICMTWG